MKKNGQATLEVAVLIIVIVAAFLAMQGFLRRSIQGQWKSSADSFSDEQWGNETETTTRDPKIEIEAFLGYKVGGKAEERGSYTNLDVSSSGGTAGSATSILNMPKWVRKNITYLNSTP